MWIRPKITRGRVVSAVAATVFVAGLVVDVGLLVRAARTGKRHEATLVELTGAVEAVERRVKDLERTDEEAQAVGAR